MSDPRDRRQPLEFEIPDLELPPPRPSQSGMHAVRIGETRVSSAPPSTSSGVCSVPAIGPTLDLGDAGDAEFDAASIQLEHEAEISHTGVLAHYGRSAALTEEDFAPAVTEALRRSVPAIGVHTSWPSGVSPVRERLILDSNEARALADYGDPPGFALLAPIYSMRVFFRRRALMEALRTIDRDIAAAEAERDALVAALGERLRPALARDASFSRLLKGEPAPVALGRAVLALRGAVEVDAATLESVRAADERVRSLVSRSELHLRAMDVCDEDKIRLGYACALVLLAGGAALAVWLMR